ncbi:30S ribosomal protein S6 [bacterium]|nr:30S ribosomal protein S6 [bacterium]
MSKKTRKGSAGQLRSYETVIVIDPQIGDDGIKTIVDKVKDILTQHQCKNVKVEEWGKRKLAYPIHKKTYGFYALFEFEDIGTAAKALEEYYHITEGLLRFLTTLTDSRLRAERLREKAPLEKPAEETLAI